MTTNKTDCNSCYSQNKFQRTVIYTGETSLHSVEEFLEEVNRDRSEDWSDFTAEDLIEQPEEIIKHFMQNDYEEWAVVNAG
jgi:hypothetical protein